MHYSWRDKTPWDANGNPLLVGRSYGQLGASVGLKDRAGRYELTLYGENLTNKAHGTLVPGLDFFGGFPVFQIVPYDFERLYGVAFQYRF